MAFKIFHVGTTVAVAAAVASVRTWNIAGAAGAASSIVSVPLGSITLVADQVANANVIANAVTAANVVLNGLKIYAVAIGDSVMTSLVIDTIQQPTQALLCDSASANAVAGTTSTYMDGANPFVAPLLETNGTRVSTFALGFAARALMG